MPADRPPHGPDQPGEGDDDPDKGNEHGEGADRPESPPERGRTRYFWRDFELADDEDTPPDRHGGQPDHGPGRLEHSGCAEAGDGEAVERASGWEHPDVADHPDRPDLDELHLPDKRREHIAKNHVSGAGRPAKSEFPPGWDQDTIMGIVIDVARNPTETPSQRPSGLWEIHGERDSVTVRTVVRPSDNAILTGYPLPGGPGVVENPPKDT